MNRRKQCAWEQQTDGDWDTACGHTFVIMDGTPADNGITFCCFCGKPLRHTALDTQAAALAAAINKSGGVAPLARKLGLKPSAVGMWQRRRMPPEHVLAVERATGVSRYRLRPDIYGPEAVPGVKG
jgi:DNA-binding transcriptional regulator YdaS (Cro superfamily)